jgi:phenylalanyl-tRNA synthetase beta subunit
MFYKPLSPLPLITRDLTVNDTNNYLHEKILQLGNLLFIDHVEYIDKYVKDGQINYTLRFYFKNSEGTTTNIIDDNFNQVKAIILKESQK